MALSHKSVVYDQWESYHQRPRESTIRKTRVASGLPQYNPDEEAEDVRDLKNRKLPLYYLFRYAIWVDYCLMFLGILAAIGAGVVFPLMINEQGEILHLGLERLERCMRLLNYTTDSKGARENFIKLHLPGYTDSIFHWFLHTLEYFGLYLGFTVTFVVCFALSAENQISRLRIAYFEALVRKDMSWLDNFVEREFGRHMTHDITQIRSALGEKLCYVAYVIVAIFGLLAVAISQQWKISLVVLVTCPVLLFIGYVGAKAENSEATYVKEVNTNSGILCEETFANIKTVKVYEGEKKEAKKFEAALQSDFGWRWILLAGSAGVTSFIMYLSFAVIFYFGSSIVWLDLQNAAQCKAHVEAGFDGPEDLFVVFFCVFYASLHIFELPTLISQLKGAILVASEVFFMIDWKPRIDNMTLTGDVPDSGVIGKIEFENVSFRYPRKPGRAALSNITMVIYPGQVIAFVGLAACGKSTILHLIQRLYDPTNGNVYVDGHNIENLNVQWLRKHMAKVSQEPVLFNRSVEENVRYAKWTASPAEVQQACKMAGIHDDILLLKNGYKTLVGQHGSLLNTSQKRQLSFARAYLQAPKILLLDDPIAGCVPEFENLVLRVITQLRDRTTIILASSVINTLVQHSDRIYCLDNGDVVEFGNHEELMEKKGLYVDLKNSSATVSEQSKFISQLTSYRFAQSLRRMHLRKARALRRKPGETRNGRKKSESRSEASQGRGNEHGHEKTSVSYAEATHHALHHDSRVKVNQAIVLRVAGGLQRTNYTRTQSNSFVHVRSNLSKAVKKVHHEMGLKQEMFSTDQSVATMFAAKMRHQRQSFSLQYEQLAIMNRPRGSIGSGSDSSGPKFVDEERKSIASSLPSMGSEDSEIFWADYEEMLDTLEEAHSLTSWKDLFKVGLMEWKYILGAVLSSMALGCVTPFYYLIFDDIFDAFAIANQAESERKTFHDCTYLVILGAVAGTFAFLQELVCSYGGFKLMTNLRRKLFAHMLKQDQEWFDKPENDVSFLCARLSTDTTLVQNVLILSLASIAQSLTALLLAICLAFSDKHLYVVAACNLGMGFVLLVVIYLDAWLQKEWEWITDIKALEDATEIEIDVITNIRTVITLGLEKHFLNDFKKEIRKSKKKLFGINILRSILFGLASALPYGLFSVAVYIFYLANRFEPAFPEILAQTGLLIFGVIPIGTALALVPNTSLSLAAAYRIMKIFSTKPKAEHYAQFEEPKDVNFELAPKIELKNIEFNFNSSIEFSGLHDFNIVARSEDKIAVVGPPGCGKSSIIQLLLGLYDPTAGQILVDDMEFKRIAIKSMRKMTAYVEQNPTIFDCSITENIAYGDNSREVPHHEIVEAATAANAHKEIIRLPEGYDTQISSLDSFQEHSFGLRQRIVFARAILRDPKLLLIDESTASVDPQSDFLLLKTLDSCSDLRTTIIASQRIEPIRNADLIVVVKNGQIVERGTDRELLDLKGEYYHMYMAQREAEGFGSEGLDYGNEIENYYKRVSLEDEGSGTPSQQRRRSSVQYMNYLKNRLMYVPDAVPRDSSSVSIDGLDKEGQQSSSLTSTLMGEYADFITAIESTIPRKNPRISQGQKFLKGLQHLHSQDSVVTEPSSSTVHSSGSGSDQPIINLATESHHSSSKHHVDSAKQDDKTPKK